MTSLLPLDPVFKEVCHDIPGVASLGDDTDPLPVVAEIICQIDAAMGIPDQPAGVRRILG